MNHKEESTHHRGWAGKRADPALNEALRPKARDLRTGQTKAESRLWGALRYRQRKGFKFRRQHVIDRFIVDFYCAEARLVIEVDGTVHDFAGERDLARQERLEALGLQVIRFRNDDVMKNLDGVVVDIEGALTGEKRVVD